MFNETYFKGTYTKEQHNKLHAMALKSAFYRGRVIDLIIPVETAIEQLIGYHLSDNSYRMTEIFSILSMEDGISIRTKSNILTFLIKQYYPELLEAHPEYLTDLEEITKYRNILAHKKMKSDPETVDNFDGDKIIITQLKTRRGKPKIENIEFNQKIIDEITTKIGKVYFSTRSLFDIIERTKDFKKSEGRN